MAITRTGAWFTDSVQPQLYFVSIGPTGALGAPRTLQLAHSGQGALNTVDPATGASAPIAGVSVPFVDGILLKGGQLYAVRTSSTRSPRCG